MSKRSSGSALFAVVLISLTSQAEPPPLNPPSADAVKATWDYFYRGKAPVLVDAKLCRRIGKIPPVQFDCETEADPVEGIKAGGPAWLWQAWLVPQGVSADIKVQISNGKVVRDELLKVTGHDGDKWRHRAWTPLHLDTPGTWTISVFHGEQVLKRLEVKVL